MKSSFQPGLVSIFIPAYNVERYITASIESVIAQTYPEWELIIVNDGSTDQTVARVSKYDDMRMRIIHQSKGGEAIAYNTALRHMRGEFLAFLSAGDVYLPQYLKLGVDYLADHSEIDGIYADGFTCDAEGNRIGLFSDRLKGTLEGYIFEQMVLDVDIFSSPTGILLRRSLLNHFNIEFDSDIVIDPHRDFLIQFAELGRFGFIGEPSYTSCVKKKWSDLALTKEQRMQCLARSQEKVTKLDAFTSLPMKIRSQVYYDLLVNLLLGQPKRQDLITHDYEFANLPDSEKVRLLSAMACRSVMHGYNSKFIKDWLDRAHELNQEDRKSAFLIWLYRLNPGLYRFGIHLWYFFLRTRPQ